MATIDWAQLCELAFMDDSSRLCLIGITTRLVVPALPGAVYQLMVAARLKDVTRGEEFDVGVSLTAPSGTSTAPQSWDSLDMRMAGPYLLLTLRDIPLQEEGIYRITLVVTGGEPVGIDVPVILGASVVPAAVH